MPVTFTINNHLADSAKFQPKETSKAFVADIRRRIDPRLPPKHAENTHLLSSSLKEADLPHIIPAKNGFLEACILAYKKHHHLVIRPDDVWISIVAGLSLYLKEHAPELRDQFTPPSSRKKLSLRTSGSSWAVDYPWLTQIFTNLLVDNLRDKELKRWVLPGFSTSTRVDVLCASVIMLGTLQSISSYEEMSLCGIPTVTLKGKKSDYERILTRLDKLSEWGEQTHYWAELLRPIIRRFISAFDGEPDAPFWNCICYSTIDQCGDEQFTGWITAFCPFDENGKWQLFTPVMPENIGHLQIDQVVYPAVYAHKIPWGYSKLDFQVIEDGKPLDVVCMAGLLGQRVTDGEADTHHSILGFIPNTHHTTISPLPAYLIFEKPVPIPHAVQYPEEYKELHQYLHQINSLETSLITGVPVLRAPSPSPVDKPSNKSHPPEKLKLPIDKPSNRSRSPEKLKPLNTSPIHGPRSVITSSTSDGRTSPRRLQKLRPRSIERMTERPIETTPNFAWRGVISRRSRSPPPGFAPRV